MADERRYSEEEGVEIIQRALNSSESDSSVSGLTQNDLWRIAEEAGASREQFDAALASTVSKKPMTPFKGRGGFSQYSTIIDGELTPDDFIILNENLPGMGVSQVGRVMTVRADSMTAMILGSIASRKGQTMVKVLVTPMGAIPAIFFCLFFALFSGFIALFSGNGRTAMLLVILAPFLSCFIAIKLNQKAKKSAQDFFDLLTKVVSEAMPQLGPDLNSADRDSDIQSASKSVEL